MGTHALASYRVLDLTDEFGFFAGKILADLGADVVKVEPPQGASSRRLGPFWNDRPNPESSLYWQAYNANKRSITLSLGSPSGRDLFRRLAAEADFVLETFRPGYLQELGLDYERLREGNPRLIWVAMTPYGQSGPDAMAPADDLEILASSGLLSLMGERGRPPARVSEPQTYVWTGMNGAMAALLANEARARTGSGQFCDVSAQASMIWSLSQAPLFWDVNREQVHRDGNYLTGRNIHGARICAIYACRDGHVNFALYGGVAGRQSNRGLAEWMRERSSREDVRQLAQSVDWDKWDVVTASAEQIAEMENTIGAFFSEVTKEEFVQAAIRYRILGYPVASPRDTMENHHLQAIGFWREVSVEGLGDVKLPGAFARFSEAEDVASHPAPRVGEHNLEVYGEIGINAEKLASLRQAGVV